MSRDPATTGAGRPFPAWAGVLLLVLGFVAWDAAVRTRHLRQVTDSYGVTVEAPRPDARSATGYADGRRSLVLPDRSMDGYHWIMQTQAMLARGDWRVRHADYDNPPQGREVHWAQPFRWFLVLLAGIDHLWTGESAALALERSSVLSGPVLLGLMLTGVTLLLARRFSPGAALVFAPAVAAAYPLYVDFEAGYVDHHGLVNTCGLLSVLFLLSHRGDFAGARRWTIAAAVAAGIGLWLSAATEVLVLAGIGLGAAAACWLGRGPDSACVWTRHPGLFRTWGRTGAGVSLAAYLMEYFPGHTGLRFEVNHPLYALAWLAGGEALCRLARLLGGTAPAGRRRDLLAAGLAGAAVALVPAVILLTRARTFYVADPFLWRLHGDFISEFESLPGFLAQNDYGWKALGFCLPMLLLLPVAWHAGRSAVAPALRAQLGLALLPALFVLPCAWGQIRWWSLEFALLLPALAAYLRVRQEEDPSRRRPALVWIAVTALLFAPGAIATVQHTQHSRELTEDDIRDLAARDAAHWLRQRAGRGGVVVAGSPTITTALIFHGGLTGVGTLYWENRDGLKAAAELYAAPDEGAAHAVVQRCGITHIVVVTWDGFEGVYVRLARGLPAGAPLPADAFIVRLLTAPEPPLWLRALAFHLPPHPALAGQQIRIYEVTAGQSPVQALVHAADFFVESGRLADVAPMVPVLADHTDSPAVNAMLAEIAWRRHDTAALDQALDRLRPQLAAAAELPFEDHVRLIEVLLAGGETGLARAQLRPCLAKATDGDLRRLAADKLAGLLRVSEAAGEAWPDPALRQLAGTLLPPALRPAVTP